MIRSLIRHFSSGAQPLRRAAVMAGVLVGVLVGALSVSVAAHAADAVGQVSLLIGEAKVFHRDGSSSALRQGASVIVGDRIETAANGHVHLRFIDNAAFSVRPDSVLEIQAYQYDAARPQSNEVRLKVANGIGRSISGAATEADKTRFRLNTPIAAIGVRGTDFIVQADAEQSRATVASGTIVMSPLGNGCLADGVGPCNGRQASVLSADMGRLMVEMRPGDRVPRVVPAAIAVLATSTPAIDARASAQAAGLVAAQPAADGRNYGNDRAAAQVLAIAPLGPFDARELNTPPKADGQLAWGRYSISNGRDNISLPFAAAFDNGGRTVTVGDGDVGLFRRVDERAAPSVFENSNKGRVDFRLNRAWADFEIGGRTEAASVDGGTLSLDFTRRTFATALALSAASAGKTELRAAGAVQPNGNFVVLDTGVHVAGTVSLDTKEAGYLFSLKSNGGLFKGRTLWGR